MKDRLTVFYLSFILVVLSVSCASLFGIEASDLTFCTLEDELFQTISTNIDDWVETFQSRGKTSYTASRGLSFSVPSGERYEASALLWNIWSDNSSPVIYVMTEWNRNERLGWAGYIYSPGQIPNYPKHNFEHLNGDIYCYTRKTWAELTQTP